MSDLQFITQWNLFQNDFALVVTFYRFQSTVPIDVFDEFASTLESHLGKIRFNRLSHLSEVCPEFDFSNLSRHLWDVPPLIAMWSSQAMNTQTRFRIETLTTTATQHENTISPFWNAFQQHKACRLGCN